MNRRIFFQAFGGAVAATLLRPRTFAAAPILSAPTLRNIGLELYAVRRAMRADPERTLAAVREIGYTDVELLWSFQNFNRTTEQVRAALTREGLKASSAHMAASTIGEGWEKSLDTAKVLGHEYLIVPGLPADTSRTLDAWRSWADRFNAAGAIARRANIWLAFHNEPGHMKPIDGQVPYDVFISRLDASVVRLQLDVGNMTMGGGDPMQYLTRFADRYWSFHLKDVVADKSRDTELGTGTMDLRRFLSRVTSLDNKPCFVEQEGPSDELASARKNFEYLRGLRWN